MSKNTFTPMTYEEIREKMEAARAAGDNGRENMLFKLIPGLTDPDARTMNQTDAGHLTPDEAHRLDQMGWAISGINSY